MKERGLLQESLILQDISNTYFGYSKDYIKYSLISETRKKSNRGHSLFISCDRKEVDSTVASTLKSSKLLKSSTKSHEHRSNKQIHSKSLERKTSISTKFRAKPAPKYT